MNETNLILYIIASIICLGEEKNHSMGSKYQVFVMISGICFITSILNASNAGKFFNLSRSLLEKFYS